MTDALARVLQTEEGRNQARQLIHAQENDDVDSFQPMRLCMVVDANSVPQVRKQVKEMFTIFFSDF